MRVMALPGVFRPLSETHLLARVLRDQAPAPRSGDRRSLDLCTGTGVHALTAAGLGFEATAVDCSRRAALGVHLNARLNGVSVRVVCGDLLDAVPGETYDLITANPPYVPSEVDAVADRGRDRAVDAGRRGRLVIDRICAEAPGRLRPGGVLLLLHSALNDAEDTLERLSAAGLAADVAARHTEPFGPVLHARAELLERRGLIAPGCREQTLVVVRAVAPATSRAPARAGRGAPAAVPA